MRNQFKKLLWTLTVSSLAFSATSQASNNNIYISEIPAITQKDFEANVKRCNDYVSLGPVKILKIIGAVAAFSGGASLSKQSIKSTPPDQNDLLSVTGIPLMGAGLWLSYDGGSDVFASFSPIEVIDLMSDIIALQNSFESWQQRDYGLTLQKLISAINDDKEHMGVTQFLSNFVKRVQQKKLCLSSTEIEEEINTYKTKIHAHIDEVLEKKRGELERELFQ